MKTTHKTGLRNDKDFSKKYTPMGGGGLVKACMTGCESDGVCDDVHDGVCVIV